MATAKTRVNIKERLHVWILGNAVGTCWETGYVVDINTEGVLFGLEVI